MRLICLEDAEVELLGEELETEEEGGHASAPPRHTCKAEVLENSVKLLHGLAAVSVLRCLVFGHAGGACQEALEMRFEAGAVVYDIEARVVLDRYALELHRQQLPRL
jgi:hypothetical protein